MEILVNFMGLTFNFRSYSFISIDTELLQCFMCKKCKYKLMNTERNHTCAHTHTNTHTRVNARAQIFFCFSFIFKGIHGATCAQCAECIMWNRIEMHIWKTKRGKEKKKKTKKNRRYMCTVHSRTWELEF